jgi:PAS domain S-box-containing protein
MDKLLMDSIRAVIAKFETEDRVVLNRSNKERQAAARSAARLFIILFVVFITGLFILFWRMRRGLKLREQYEQRIAYLASLTEKTHDAIFSTDTNLLVKSWNNGAREMYGYTAEEVLGRSVSSLLKIASPKNDLDKSKIDLDTLGHYKGEYEAIKKSGEPVFIHASVSVLRDEKNEPEGYVAVHRDITERKKSEQLLKIFNEKLSLQVEEKTVLTDKILERISDGFYSLDDQWNFTYMNKTAAMIMGCDPREIVGKNLWQEFPEAVNLSIYQGYLKAFEEQQYSQVEFYYPPFEKWFMVDIYPSHSGISTFFRDVTERKKAEEELKHSNERFEMISRTTNDAVWEWNLESGVMWANETHQQLYGLTLSDPVPPENVWQQRIHPEDRERLMGKQAEALAGNTNIFITEYRFNTEENGYRNVYDRCYIVRNAKGKAIRILGSMMDITELKKAEEKKSGRKIKTKRGAAPGFDREYAECGGAMVQQ